MEHDHNIGVRFQCSPVAGLLISAVAEILRVDQSRNAELFCDGNSVIVACVINQNDAVDNVSGNFSKNPFKRASRSVSGQNYDDPAAVQHRSNFILDAGNGEFSVFVFRLDGAINALNARSSLLRGVGYHDLKLLVAAPRSDCERQAGGVASSVLPTTDGA